MRITIVWGVYDDQNSSLYDWPEGQSFGLWKVVPFEEVTVENWLIILIAAKMITCLREKNYGMIRRGEIEF